ncbi:MAG: hypothetical protein G01um101493_76 [Microgenomates group bacterium Gr01-1014_93]|nr:MAG: hypothetical protein G01um101493_76 [Microgenomates group bacterium Gr01-1014_93]
MEKESLNNTGEPEGWPDVSYEEYIGYLKSINEFKENDPWLSRERWEEMSEIRRQSSEFSERFKGFVRAPKECPDCDLLSKYRSFGGSRSKVELIFKCPNEHELRFYYGSFDRVE